MDYTSSLSEVKQLGRAAKFRGLDKFDPIASSVLIYFALYLSASHASSSQGDVNTIINVQRRSSFGIMFSPKYSKQKKAARSAGHIDTDAQNTTKSKKPLLLPKLPQKS